MHLVQFCYCVINNFKLNKMKLNSVFTFGKLFGPVIVTILVLLSCHSEIDDPDNVIATRSVDNVRDSLISFVAQSLEYTDFVNSTEQYYNKSEAYYSSLSMEEKEEYMANVNNDDYLSEYIKRADLFKEIENVSIASRNLWAIIKMVGLEDWEISSVFYYNNNFISHIGVKTRSEGNSNDCEAQRLSAKIAATNAYNNSIMLCQHNNDDFMEYNCLEDAKQGYQRALQEADEEFRKCMSEKIGY